MFNILLHLVFCIFFVFSTNSCGALRVNIEVPFHGNFCTLPCQIRNGFCNRHKFLETSSIFSATSSSRNNISTKSITSNVHMNGVVDLPLGLAADLFVFLRNWRICQIVFGKSLLISITSCDLMNYFCGFLCDELDLSSLLKVKLFPLILRCINLTVIRVVSWC